jgi:hypothetical protein
VRPEEAHPKPTIVEAKAARAHSAVRQNMLRVCSGLVQLARRIEPFLKGTPAETPMAVFIAITDAVEVRFLSSALHWSVLTYDSQAVHDTDENAKVMMENLTDRLSVVENALLQTEHPESAERIVAFAKCVQLDDSGFRFSFSTRRLVTKALELNGIRGSSVWKKVLETKKLKDKVKKIVDQIDEETKTFSVRSSDSHLWVRVLTSFRFPSLWPLNEIQRISSSVLS